MPRAQLTPPAPKPEPRLVLTGAVLRACALLEITQSSLAQILGLSPSTVSRMANGTYRLDDQKKEWELGALFVRLFRSLDAVIGSNDSAARAWLNGQNTALTGRPVELIRSTEGLVRVVQYLDAARGRL
jgi:transcriptional regulator with XRE-family HTH domain